MTPVYSRIVATGSYLPRKILTNADLEARIDTSDSWIRERTGIVQRHISAPDETVSMMSEQAARNALAMAGLAPEDLDLIVMGTTTPDQIFPNSATMLQERLGIARIGAFTLEAACSGFIYALNVADKFIRTGDARRVLVVGAEMMSQLVDWSDRTTCVLFGDGAGAVILEAAAEPGIIGSLIHADGRYRDLLEFPGGVGRDFRNLENVYLQMRGSEVFKVAVATLGQSVEECLARFGHDKSELDWLIPHQANVRIIQATARRLGMPMDQVVVTVDHHGNTSTASIPLALDAAVRDGRIQRGQLLLLEAFGGGFTWGSALVRF
ncbi:beta-ketoacyl-ACP synthase III [Candidatus Macondimonas diazotrophica]|uniref:Beta-ketoacyl-[acyl-carrier-protein] synthase III n=1 Tax=Candidatus Macondimonas diazotrophica TaxID=2305248 RepID=A0A4Z0FB77_9GAMM|nr:beta-ketoacyl-ACP synthase III [Candidatus Macondimonas diazotrophica]NCU00754.1 ketoacyl-ACP synthase III [Candidatus Macondimonas diazotrophica]TFZ83468.1 ketoacyl-ACP synthase III [Candidatus Macondimonas diazotrophica]HBG30566.1 3-oxoacyl-ACP synthase [Gammaproteobacteria bacterium]HBG52052.1 3-oxoacyl-ACP synthase [Gammaproteobacteria bacterium]